MRTFFLIERVLEKHGIEFQRDQRFNITYKVPAAEIFIPSVRLVIRSYSKEFKASDNYRKYLTDIGILGYNVVIMPPAMQPFFLSNLQLFLEGSSALQGERWPFGKRQWMEECLNSIREKLKALQDVNAQTLYDFDALLND